MCPEIQASHKIAIHAVVELIDGREVRGAISMEMNGPHHLLALRAVECLTGRDITGLLSDGSICSLTELASQLAKEHGRR